MGWAKDGQREEDNMEGWMKSPGGEMDGC